MADGILTSCYASVNHELAHLGLTPLRWFPDLIQWMFGEETGFQIFVGIVEQLEKWTLPHLQFGTY